MIWVATLTLILKMELLIKKRVLQLHISMCELNSLIVLAVSCNGASSNRRLFCMHFPTTKDDE